MCSGERSARVRGVRERLARRTTLGLQLLLLAGGPAYGAIPDPERQALLDFYASTNGPGWSVSSNWNGAAGTECTWFGVTCNGGQTTVIRIALPANQLSGPLPASLGNLSNLQDLWLNSNQLSGSIPSTAGNPSLVTIWLRSNQLSGPIPSFGANPGLLDLDLGLNQLSGTIPSFAANTSLQNLYLHSNQLSGTIPSFAGNTSLRNLWLCGNRLSGAVHASLGTLTNLIPNAGLELRWNALFSTDSALIAFLNTKQLGGNWQGTQTIAPTGLSATGLLPGQVTVNWTPIAYTGDTGYYQVLYATSPGGPYTPFATVTANKAASSLAVTGLAQLTPYYFVVKTTTLPHPNNPNTVVSEPSAELPASTTPVELLSLEVG